MKFSKDGVTIHLKHKSFGYNDMRLFILNHIPKMIFKDPRLRKLSYIDIDFNEHQIKRHFRGQTYITFKVIQTFDDNGSIRLKMISKDAKDYNALVMASKREIRTVYPHLKLANKEYVYQQAKTECEEYLKDYENLLNGNIFSMEIDNSNEKIPLLITGTESFAADVLSHIELMQGKVLLAVEEMTKTEEFKEMFNRFDNRINFNNEKK